jgi:hypothetical protein
MHDERSGKMPVLPHWDCLVGFSLPPSLPASTLASRLTSAACVQTAGPQIERKEKMLKVWCSSLAVVTVPVYCCMTHSALHNADCTVSKQALLVAVLLYSAALG